MSKNGMRRGVTAVLLAAWVSGCAVPMTPQEIDARARQLADEWCDREPGRRWYEKLASMDRLLQRAVLKEIARRGIAEAESMEEVGAPVELPEFDSFATSWTLLFDEDPVCDPFLVDLVVWVAAHTGTVDIGGIWGLGARAVPPLLQLRADRHRSAQIAAARALCRLVVSKERGLSVLLRDELTRCPEDLRPHYRAILAAAGDPAGLSAIPELLDADVTADRILGLHLVVAMFGSEAPVEVEALLNADRAYDGKGAEVWTAMVDRTLAWWAERRESMTYDPASGRWRVR